MTVAADEIDGAERVRAEKMHRRQIDNEIYMLQSDRSRFERQSNELEAQIRMMEKDIADRTYALEARKADRNRAIRQVQDIDAEIMRVKRSTYKK
jgi:septal ring factor EnvC (AmiA/AmiB activator)